MVRETRRRGVERECRDEASSMRSWGARRGDLGLTCPVSAL